MRIRRPAAVLGVRAAFFAGAGTTASAGTTGVAAATVDGDGWPRYFGWPTDASAPFRFTADGTEIDQLVYGKLGVPRYDVPPVMAGTMSSAGRSMPPATSGHRAGSTLLRSVPTCTTTITAVRKGLLYVGGLRTTAGQCARL